MHPRAAPTTKRHERRRFGIVTLAGGLDGADSGFVPAAFEGSCEKDVHKPKRGRFIDHPLAERDHVRVIMRAGEPGGFFIPADGAANSANLVCDHCLAIAGAAQNDPTFALAGGNSLSRGTNERGIINGGIVVGSEIGDLLAALLEMFFDPFFVIEAGVVGGDRNLHRLMRRGRSQQLERGLSARVAPLRSFDGAVIRFGHGLPVLFGLLRVECRGLHLELGKVRSGFVNLACLQRAPRGRESIRGGLRDGGRRFDRSGRGCCGLFLGMAPETKHRHKQSA